MITVRVDGIQSVQRRLDDIAENLQGRVMSAAINKTAAKARAEINRAIRDEYAVRADEVRNAITVREARTKALSATIQIFGSQSKRGRSMNMVRFVEAMVTLAAARKRMKGGEGGIQTLRNGGQIAKALELRFKIKKGTGLKMIKGAFLGNKGRTVFIREGKARLPIKPVQVIGFSQMFNSRKIHDRVLAKINADLPVEIDRAIKMVLAKAAK